MNTTTKTMSGAEFFKLQREFQNSIQGRYDVVTESGNIVPVADVAIRTDVFLDDEKERHDFILPTLVFSPRSDHMTASEARLYLHALLNAIADVENFQYEGWEVNY